MSPLMSLSTRFWSWIGPVLCLVAGFGAHATAEEWKFDVIRLRNGNSFEGLLVENGADQVRFRIVRHRPGSPHVVITDTFKRSEISSVELLDPADHDALDKRLKALAVERQTWGALLRAIDPALRNRTPPSEFDKLDLSPVAWGKLGTGTSYQSTNFRLLSNAREDLIYLTATQLELIYSAYMRYLPPRVKTAQPTTVLLPKSRADYQELLADRGQVFLNTAFYDPVHNQIVCPSDLQRLADEWTEAYQKHHELKEKLREEEADLKKLYGKNVPADLTARLDGDMKRINKQDETNRKQCGAILQRLFQPLYHEAFHAYLANYVYPEKEAFVPRWLNEGLAQLFETAILEAGELQIDRPDIDRLASAQRLLHTNGKSSGEGLVPLSDLLGADFTRFRVAHNNDKQTSDRYYLTSWALARYLTFDRKLLGTPPLDEYVRALRGGSDPLVAFQTLVGQGLPEFERAFRQYLQRLSPDGTLAGP